MRIDKVVERLSISIPEGRAIDEKSKTPGSENSRVRKVSATDEKKWTLPIFSDKDLPENTTENNTIQYNLASSSGVTTATLKVGQVFENKEDLKTKFHLHAMSKNFEFKVKKSRPDIWYISCIDDKCCW